MYNMRVLSMLLILFEGLKGHNKSRATGLPSET